MEVFFAVGAAAGGLCEIEDEKMMGRTGAKIQRRSIARGRRASTGRERIRPRGPSPPLDVEPVTVRLQATQGVAMLGGCSTPARWTIWPRWRKTPARCHPTGCDFGGASFHSWMTGSCIQIEVCEVHLSACLSHSVENGWCW